MIRKAARYAGWPAVIAALAVALVAVNVLASRFPLRLDLTLQRQFSLSEQTLKLIRTLDKPVKISAVIHRNTPQGDVLEELVRQYRRHSPRITTQVVDFSRSPNVARQLGADQPNILIVESEGKRKRVEGYNLFSTTPDLRGVEFRGEQALTRAILEVTGRSGKKVYFLEGHGEPGVAGLGRLRSLVEGEGYALEGLNLAVKGKVPDDAMAVVIMGPQEDLDQKEADLLLEYGRKRKGKLFLLADPLPGRSLPQLGRLAREVGVELRDDVVIDPVRGAFMDPTAPVPVGIPHPITDPIMAKRLNLVLPGARSLGERKAEGLTLFPLLQSSPDAWGEKDPLAGSWKRDPGEPSGPLHMAVAVSAENRPLAVVVGNSSFVQGNALSVRGNVDFFLNALAWLVGEESLISVRPKPISPPRADVTVPLGRRIFYGTVVAIPLLTLVGGGSIWLRRRRL